MSETMTLLEADGPVSSKQMVGSHVDHLRGIWDCEGHIIALGVPPRSSETSLIDKVLVERAMSMQRLSETRVKRRMPYLSTAGHIGEDGRELRVTDPPLALCSQNDYGTPQ